MNRSQPIPRQLIAGAEAMNTAPSALERANRASFESSLSLLQATLDSTADGILVVDLQGKVILHNSRFRSMWSVPPELVEAEDDERLLVHVASHFEDPAAFIRRVRELYAQPEEEVFDEILPLDGRIVERYSTAQRIDGQCMGRVWSFRDVTERRRVELRLRESEARYRQLFSLTPISIWEEDYTEVGRWMAGLRREGVRDLRAYIEARPEAPRNALRLVRVLDVSDASLAMFDAPSKSALIQGMESLYTEESYRRVGEMLVAIWEGRTHGAGEITGVTLKGRRVDMLVHWAIPLADGRLDLARVVFAIDDLSERVRLQDELLKSQKLESIGTLAGGIAHDFNNLLAVVVGQASMQLRDQQLPGRLRESLKDILHAAERGSALTQQLLAYARGAWQRPVPVDLNVVIESVMKILRRTLPPQVEVTQQLDANLAHVMGDPSQVEQVVMNLCLNAAQASTAPGRVEVITEAAPLDAERAAQWGLTAGRYVLLRVRDQGRGMEEAVMERIFEPFFTTRPDGRGMGLSVTLGVVKGLGGHIDVVSAPGCGTTMTVWLPAVEAPKGAPAATTGRSRPPQLPRGSETVLVIDDDAAVCRTVDAMLSSLGYCVTSRGEPEAALSLLESNAEDFHLILLDANLPRFTLEEMFARVRELCPRAAVLLASGFALEERCAPLIAQGAAGFVQKPFSMATLAKQVRTALDAVPH